MCAERCCSPISTREQINGSIKWTELRTKAHCPLAHYRCRLRCALFPLTAAERLTEKEAEDLMAWMRNALGSRVTGVKVGVLRLGNCVQETHGDNNLGEKDGD